MKNVFSSSLLILSMAACAGDSDETSPVTSDDDSGKSDTTFQSLAGSYYAFDGTGWWVVSFSRPTSVGGGTYYANVHGAAHRGTYTVVDKTLVQNPGTPGELTSTFARTKFAGVDVLAVTNLHGTGTFFGGPLFCETSADCLAQAIPPADAAWSRASFMCAPRTP